MYVCMYIIIILFQVKKKKKKKKDKVIFIHSRDIKVIFKTIT